MGTIDVFCKVLAAQGFDPAHGSCRDSNVPVGLGEQWAMKP